MIAHQHMGVHLPPSHYYSTNGMMMHSYPTNAYGALPHLTAPYGHRSEQRMHTHLSNKGGYGAAGYYAPAAQMHASYAHQAQAQAQAQAHQEYYAREREQQHQQRAALLGASGDNNRHEMGLVYNHNGNAALPEHSHHHHHHSSRNGNGADNGGADGDDDDDGRAAHATTSSSDLNEERAHLDRLFSALAAAHPHPHPNPGLSHSSNGLSNGYNGAAGNGAATGGNANGYSQSELSLGRSYAARMNSNEQVQQQQQARHPLWASTGLAQGYAPQATHQLSLPPPSFPAPHQGTGLQPAFDFGPAQLPGLPSSLFSVTDREVEHNLTVSAGRYDQSLVGQERREQAVLLHEQAKRNEVAAAAAWADYAVQQQKQQGQTQMQAHEQARALTQQELAEVILPGKEFTLDDEPQLIPTDASAIPPPPPIEKSAHPLAALATDLVWEAFLSAASSNSAFPHLGTSPSVPSSGSQSPMYLPHQHGRGNGSDSDSGMFLGSAGNGSSRTSPLPGYGGSVSTHLGASVTMPRTPGNISSAKKSHVRSTSKSLSPSSHGVIGRTERATSVPRGDAETPGTGNVYGAIGGERRPRHGSTLATRHDASPGSRSDSSSPASTAPGTPASSSATANCLVKTSSETSLGAKMSKRLSGGLPWASSVVGGGNGEDVDSFSNANKDIYQAGLLKNPLHYQQGQTQAQQQQAHQRFAHHLSPPMSLFEQIQKLLGATLLSQQVLLLALYFVAKTPHTCPLYPPATSQSALKSTSAPFKLLLAALVVANKHLDDNSFRNSTFAQVANVTLPEVNSLEFSMLSSLDFDINVASSDWLAWLRDLQYQRTTRFTHDQAQVVNVENIITPLVEGVVVHQKEHARLFFKSEPTSQRAVDSSSKMTLPRDNSAADIAMMPFSPEEHDENFSSFANASFDMDASGPLEAEQRPQYSKAFGAAPIPVGNAFKQHQNAQHSVRDEPMFFTSGYMDEDLSQNQNGYSDWDMPEDPYASHVRF